MSDTAQAMADIELSIVVPVYQEEQAVPVFLSRIQPVLERITEDYEIIFSMDPGRDRTGEVIEAAIRKDPRIRLLVMTRRWGQPAATLAGIEHCGGQACVVIDVDLQDPPELIAEMMAKWREGYEVVYAQRRTRDGETWHHLLRAKIGYRMINRISEVQIPCDTGDFRLIDRKVIEYLKSLPEIHGYLRGLVPYIGFRQTGILFDRKARTCGMSKYGRFVGDMRININGLVAFSNFPLQIAALAGLAFLVIAAAIAVVAGCRWLALSVMPSAGWMLTAGLFFVGGIQLMCAWITGEYVGRIYEEARRRPKYMVAKKINFTGMPG